MGKAPWRRRYLHRIEPEWELGLGQVQKPVPGRGGHGCLRREAQGMVACEEGAVCMGGARGPGGMMTQAASLRLHPRILHRMSLSGLCTWVRKRVKQALKIPSLLD